MSISPVTYEALQKLVGLDSELLAKLRHVRTLDAASGIIAASAKSHGITLDVTELNRYLQASLDSSRDDELSDAELAGVAGGSGIFEFISEALFSNHRHRENKH
ncbi:hypothetical protein [Pollutimonas sp. M17]|uniref:hypothetical protein n=1 Tax=Pollutimonas sp. M17 TaxID=2962065 RepID=UPI0021F4273B|nr:hypothetical protein [Pollutimonas sp. M17]UYO92208.1 hypothetical protein OEG81_09715 [Pollutimonas sp. M17]